LCSAEAFAQEWNYRENGPARWGDLDRSFNACGAGDQQSPIDLREGIKADLPKLTIHLPKDRVTVWNNGHTIQVSSPAGASLGLGATAFPLAQFHFHSPSEHAIEGKQAAMEIHFVFSHRDAQLTVVAAMLMPGRRNPAFAEIMAIAPERRDVKSQTAAPIDARQVLPDRLGPTWRYEGSLTTPPCSQTVDWIVFNNHVEVAENDIARFRNIFPMNARPRQPLNRRFLLKD
jgi:carbonic anhydrase